jgi:hypothetical protein
MYKLFTSKCWSFLLLLVALGSNVSEVQAQSITFSYIFDGLVLTGTSSQPGASANNATYGAGLGIKTFYAGNPGDAIAGDGFASGTPLNTANNDFFGFSFTASACSTVTLTSVSFDARRSGTGPANFEIRYSTNNFASSVFSGVISGTNFESKSGALASLVVPAGETVSFRLYGFNASGSTGTLRVDNVRFSGTIAASVPTVFAVTGGGAVCPPAGASVGLTGSQLNVNYQLRLNGSPIGAPVGGNGGVLSFGNQTSFGTYTVVATNANGCTSVQSGSVVISQSSNCGGECNLTSSTTQVDVLCNGNATGSIDLSPNAGTPSYTYIWSNGATTQDLSNLVAGTYAVTVTDAVGCSAFSSATITQAPAMVLTTTQVNALCNSLGSIDLSVSGGTPGYTYEWSNGASTQDISNLAADTYTVTVTDANGCTKTTSATITQAAVIILSASLVQPSNCFVADGSIDLSVSGGNSPYTYDWSNDGPESPDNDPQDLQNLPEGTYTVTVTDANGCTADYTAILDYQDVVKPNLSCPDNISIAAGADCASTVGSHAPVSLSDNCTANPGVQQNPISSTILNSANPSRLVTLTATDEAGNTQTCAFTVSLIDTTGPSIVCPLNQTVMADANCSGILGTWTPVSVNDNCSGNVNVVQSPESFTILNGHNDSRTVTLTATDDSNNSQSCSFTVSLADRTSPSLSCPASITIHADENCSGLIDAFSPLTLSDNCTVNPTVIQDPIAGTELNGHNASSLVTLTATDEAGNTQTCSLTVTLRDVTPPVLICKPFTTDLNAAGVATITAADIYESGSDNCSEVVILSVAPLNFNCSNLGDNLVTLVVADSYGNRSWCRPTVTVRDPIAPIAKCKDASVNLDQNGTGIVAPSSVNDGTTDNCSFTLSLEPGTFGCANIGLSTLTLIATDGSGNTSTCTATVRVSDFSAPIARCKNPTIYLDDTGHVTLTPEEVNNGSNDACGIASMSIDVTEFNCSNLPGSSWPVRLSLVDINGNTSFCISNVTVKEVLAPTAICENITIALGANGRATVYGEDLAFNSFDNCSVWSFSPVARIYTAANLGANNLTVTVSDWSGNTSTCVSVVTVIAPGNSDFQQGGNGKVGITGVSDFVVYPNPTSGAATVAFQLPAEEPFVFQMFDTAGRLVYSHKGLGIEGENILPLRLEGVASGLYLLDIQSETGKMQQRLMLQK